MKGDKMEYIEEIEHADAVEFLQRHQIIIGPDDMRSVVRFCAELSMYGSCMDDELKKTKVNQLTASVFRI